jgi:hypothetical protein
MVGDLLSSEGERRSWLLTWRRRLFQWEEENLAHLVTLLESVFFSSDEDGWRWLPDSDGVFSVNSTYKFLLNEIRREDDVVVELVGVLDQIWNSVAPSKVIVFS